MVAVSFNQVKNAADDIEHVLKAYGIVNPEEVFDRILNGKTFADRLKRGWIPHRNNVWYQDVVFEKSYNSEAIRTVLKVERWVEHMTEDEIAWMRANYHINDLESVDVS